MSSYSESVQHSVRQVIGPMLVACIVLQVTGCGSTKWSDTSRTATEQLLISDSMDRAVSQLDFRALAGKTVFLDDAPLKPAVDSEYLSSSLRQHLLANGAILKEKKDEADYVVEARTGAVGTDNSSLLFGIPQINMPQIASAVPGVPSSVPEVPFIKKTQQRAVTKIALFAYNRQTGRPLWQSGRVQQESLARNVWVFGAGPFERGSIYDGTQFAGDKLDIPLIDFSDQSRESISVADEAFFVEPRPVLADSENGGNGEAGENGAEGIRTASRGEGRPAAPPNPPAGAGIQGPSGELPSEQLIYPPPGQDFDSQEFIPWWERDPNAAAQPVPPIVP